MSFFKLNLVFSKKEKELFSFIRNIAEKHNIIVRVSGGYIRDKILCLENSPDIDLAIEGMSGREFAEIVSKTQSTGIVHIIEARPEQSKHLETAMLDVLGFSIDFVGLRKETYADSRIPTIEQGTILEDASRRDLTVNAMYYNLHTEQVEDYFNGLDDLKNRVARTPIESRQTFLDDPLRILRTIRFCVKYGLDASAEIELAAQDLEVQEAFQKKISKERIWKEMIGLADKPGFLFYSNSMSFVRKFQFMDLLFTPLGVTLNPWDTDQNSPHHDLSIQNHTIRAFEVLFQNLSQRVKLSFDDKAVILLSMIMHDLGKRDPNFIQVHERGHFQYLGHDGRSTELCEIVLDQLSAPNDIKRRVIRMVDNHMRYHVIENNCKDKVLRKIMRDMEDDWRLLIEHCLADAYGKVHVEEGMADRYISFLQRSTDLVSAQGNVTKPVRPITGHDLMSLGVKQGPTMGELFKGLDELLLEIPNLSKEDALAWVQKQLDSESVVE